MNESERERDLPFVNELNELVAIPSSVRVPGRPFCQSSSSSISRKLMRSRRYPYCASAIHNLQKIPPRLTRSDQTNKMLTSLPSMQTN